MKKRVTALADELHTTPEELLARIKTVLAPRHYKGRGKNTWITASGCDLLRQSEECPMTVSRIKQAIGIAMAANKRWMYATVDGFHGKVPVLIPRKLIGQLEKKKFQVEVIEDTNGVTFRHAALSGKTGHHD